MIEEGESTFTLDRLQTIVNQDLIAVDLADPGPRWRETWLAARDTRYENEPGGDIYCYGSKKQKERALEWCQAYVDQCTDPETPLEQIDRCHSHLVRSGFYPEQSGGISAVIQRARLLLRRLPATPIPLALHSKPWSSTALHPDYFLPHTERSWETLKVVHFVDSNVIRLALRLESSDPRDIDSGKSKSCGSTETTVALANTVFELLRTTVQHIPGSVPRFIVMAFLWTSWHRILTLHFHEVVREYLNRGCDCLSNRLFSVDGMWFLQQTAMTCYSLPQRSNYMCRWAFEMLYRDRVAIGVDFRSLHERFAGLFNGTPPRCVISGGIAKQCKGDSPFNCMRFKGMTIENQSAHSASCPGSQNCRKLLWHERSYREHCGARVVSLKKTDNTFIHYRSFTQRTMAISHVWSHGQGGGPEAVATHSSKEYCGGFNQCLHTRYKSIALSLGCDSYWMDTPCIPGDHQLRREAINNINHVFADSKLTLICDRDLMEIDAGKLTLEIQESILATILVCDWNVRAWTLLEAMRGRQNIHVLCKNEVVVCLKDLITYVNAHGSIAIANLFLSAQHLLPQMKRSSQSLQRYSRGFLKVEEAAYALRHRHASRPGDDIVIWSLLCDEIPCYTASELWHTQTKLNEFPSGCIDTGFLISSIPRIQERGLTWAPSQPGLPEDSYHSNCGQMFTTEDGALSSSGFFTEEGLSSSWHIIEFPGGSLPWPSRFFEVVKRYLSERNWILDEIRQRFLEDYSWGAIITPAGDGEDRYRYVNHSDGMLVAVLGSNDNEDRRWTWKGIYDWKLQAFGCYPYDRQERRKILIV